MAQTYCGKNCAECVDRAKLNCSGCKSGPGNPYSGDCGIARCCVSRGHTICEECTTASTCFQWKHRDDVAASRVRRLDADADRQIAFAQKADRLAKWLWSLFWLVIVSLVINFMFSIMETLPGMKVVSELVSAGFSVGYALILLKLGEDSYCFKISGICKFVCLAFSLIGLFFADEMITGLFTLGALIPSFVAEYQEYMGYSEVTEDVDEDLSGKWRTVWFLSLGSLIGMGVGLLFTLFGSLFGAFLTLIAAIVTLVAQIMKIVYLYKSAQLFRSIY